MALGVFLGAVVAAFAPTAIKPLGVLIALLATLQVVPLRRAADILIRSRPFQFVALYAVFMVASAVENQSAPANLLQSLSIVLVFPLFALLAAVDEERQGRVLMALTIAGTLYTLRYAIIFDWSQLFNPAYRGDKDVDVFVALNAALLLLFSANYLVCGRKRNQPARVALALTAATYAVLLLIMIKSRGTVGAVLVSLVYIYIKSRSFSLARTAPQALFFLAASCAIVIAAAPTLSDLTATTATLFNLSGEGIRSLSTGSGRLIAWDYSINVLWPEAFWLGHGPRANFELLLEATRIHGAHNAFIAALVDGGMWALIAVSLLVLRPIFLFRRNRQAVCGYEYYIVLLAAVVNENLLFAFGTPFSWLGLLVLARLGQSRQRSENPSDSPTRAKTVRYSARRIT